MKKHIINCVIFCMFMLVVMVMNFQQPKGIEISEVENRVLAKFPAYSTENLWSGQYFMDIEAYYADHFFNREQFVMISKTLASFKGIQSEEEVSLVSVGTTNEYEAKQPVVPSSQDTTTTDDEGNTTNNSSTEKAIEVVTQKGIETEPDTSNEDLAELNKEKETVKYQETQKALEEAKINENETGEVVSNFLIVGDTVYELFAYKKSAGAYYANAINDFANKVGDQVKVYSMLVPTHIEFIGNPKFEAMNAPQDEAIADINTNFGTNVTPVDAYSNLKNHSDAYLYFRTDHHWTAQGAYYAYCAFAKTAGQEPTPLFKFEEVVVEGFLGTLYDKTLNPKVAKNPDTVYVYKPFVENDYVISLKTEYKTNVINMGYAKLKNKYLMFISGDSPKAVIKTATHNGKKILVVKDSYGNAFIPFLLENYEEIHMIDPRHFEGNMVDYVKDQGIRETLFLNYLIVVSTGKGYANDILEVDSK